MNLTGAVLAGGRSSRMGRERFSSLPYPAFEGVIPNAGPLGGVHSALTNSPSDQIAVVACDLPLISKRIIEYLLQQRSPDCEITVSKRGIWHNRYWASTTGGIYQNLLIFWGVAEGRCRSF